ncbi:MAG: hypothetical protein AB7G13_22540 [Lautropia sp.]
MAVRIIPFFAQFTDLPMFRHSRRWSLHIDDSRRVLVEQAWATTEEVGSYSGSDFMTLETFLASEQDRVLLAKLRQVLDAEVAARR